MKKFWNVWLRSLTALTWSMALTPKLKFLPALKIAELAKASPCIRLGAGAFCAMLPPNSCGRNYQPADIIFYIEHTKRVD